MDSYLYNSNYLKPGEDGQILRIQGTGKEQNDPVCIGFGPMNNRALTKCSICASKSEDVGHLCPVCTNKNIRDVKAEERYKYRMMRDMQLQLEKRLNTIDFKAVTREKNMESIAGDFKIKGKKLSLKSKRYLLLTKLEQARARVEEKKIEIQKRKKQLEEKEEEYNSMNEQLTIYMSEVLEKQQQVRNNGEALGSQSLQTVQEGIEITSLLKNIPLKHQIRFQLEKAAESLNSLFTPNLNSYIMGIDDTYSNIFRDFGSKEFKIELVTLSEKLEQEFIVLDSTDKIVRQSLTSQEEEDEQLGAKFHTPMKIVTDYIPTSDSNSKKKNQQSLKSQRPGQPPSEEKKKEDDGEGSDFQKSQIVAHLKNHIVQNSFIIKPASMSEKKNEIIKLMRANQEHFIVSLISFARREADIYNLQKQESQGGASGGSISHILKQTENSLRESVSSLRVSQHIANIMGGEERPPAGGHQKQEGLFQGVLNAAAYWTGGANQSSLESSSAPQLRMTLYQRIRFENDKRIQGVVHALCLFLFCVKRYLNISLPYPIRLSPEGGFVITHPGKNSEIPLFIFSQDEAKGWGKVASNLYQLEEFLERGIILLNANFKFLNRLVGHPLKLGAEYESVPPKEETDLWSSQAGSPGETFWKDTMVAKEGDSLSFLDLTPFLKTLRRGDLGRKVGPSNFGFTPGEVVNSERLKEKQLQLQRALQEWKFKMKLKQQKEAKTDKDDKAANSDEDQGQFQIVKSEAIVLEDLDKLSAIEILSTNLITQESFPIEGGALGDPEGQPVDISQEDGFEKQSAMKMSGIS